MFPTYTISFPLSAIEGIEMQLFILLPSGKQCSPLSQSGELEAAISY